MIVVCNTVIGKECYTNKGEQGSDGKEHQRTILLLCGLAVSKHNKNERYEGNKIHARHISKKGTDQRIKKKNHFPHICFKFPRVYSPPVAKYKGTSGPCLI